LKKERIQMPVYEYICAKCNEKFEVFQKITDDPLHIHESCGGDLRKLITNTSFVLKGGGWYVTDYPSVERKKAMEARKTSASKKDAGNGQKKDTNKEKAETAKAQ
jgi:putative FmdB family regulatory protein